MRILGKIKEAFRKKSGYGKIKDALEARNNYLINKKLSRISTTYKVNSFPVEYGSAIKNFNKAIFYDPRNKFKIKFKKSSFIMGKEFPLIKGYDSRLLLVRSCHNIFKDTKLAVESLNLISRFLVEQRIKDKPEYVKEFTKILHQVGYQRYKKEITIENNEFIKNIIKMFSEKPAREEYNARLHFIKSISNDFIAFCKRNKIFKFNVKKVKSKIKLKHTVK